MTTREAFLHADYSIRTVTKMSICVALCCVSAYISIPLPFTTAMITALTVVMNLTAFILKPKQTLIVMLVWILLGSAGLPVFVGGTAGFGRLFGPTGGFIIAFAIAYPLVSLLKGQKNSFIRYSLMAVIIGIPITYLGGVISMMLVLQVTFWQACVMAVFPFIPGDIAKAVLAAFLGVRINKLYHD